MLVIRLLGGFEVAVDGTPITLPSRPAQSLLAYLALHPGGHRREKLAGALWPDSSEENGRNNLRHTLWRVRKALGDADVIAADKVEVELRGGPEVRIDAHQLIGGDLDAYGGELLPGFYEDWVLLERERLQAAFERTIHERIDGAVDAERWQDVVNLGERWIAHGRAPEPAFRALMLAQAELGDRGAVEATFRRCVDALDKHLGVRPSEETRRLHYKLSRQFSGVLQAPTLPSHLPAQPTSFHGRETELARIATLFDDPTCRLLTLHGPGGSGKTRLALAAAQQLEPAFPHGAHFVPLSSVEAPEMIAPAIAEALRFSFFSDSPPEQQLANYLRKKQMLLIVDNFEQVLDGAPVIATLLETAPKVRAIATTRARLNLRAEWVLDVDGLELTDAVELFGRRASALDASWRPTDADRAAIERIAELTERMPLAIELAAGWIRDRSCAELAEQLAHSLEVLETPLRDVPERHRNIAAVFEHSWQLLTADAQRVFARLSVFRGGFEVDAASAVAGATESELAHLVEHALVRQDDTGRYGVHELLRQFGAGKLDDDVATREAHARYYAEQIAEHGPRLRGPDADDAIAASDRELENVRAAWDTALRDGHRDLALAMAEPTRRLLQITGRDREGYDLFRRAAEALPDPAVRVRYGVFAYEMARYDEAVAALEASLADATDTDAALATLLLGQTDYRRTELDRAEQRLIDARERFRALGDDYSASRALQVLALVVFTRGEHQRALEHIAEALDGIRAIGDRRGIALGSNTHGMVLSTLGNYTAAREAFHEAVEIRRQMGDPAGTASVLNNLGVLCQRLDELEEARDLHQEARALREEAGDRFGLGCSLNNLGEVALSQHRWEDARVLFDACLELRYEIGDELGIASAMVNQGIQLREQGMPREAIAPIREALARAARLRALPKALDATCELAGCLAALGNDTAANRMYRICAAHPSTEGDRRTTALIAVGQEGLEDVELPDGAAALAAIVDELLDG